MVREEFIPRLCLGGPSSSPCPPLAWLPEGPQTRHPGGRLAVHWLCRSLISREPQGQELACAALRARRAPTLVQLAALGSRSLRVTSSRSRLLSW